MKPVDSEKDGKTKSQRNAKFQYFAAMSANIIIFGFGTGIGWLNPALPLLQSKESPLTSGPLTIEEISWIGSILSLGALAGNFLVGYLINLIGTRNVVMLLGVPQLFAWLLMIFGTEAFHLYAARFLVGIFGGGGQISISLFVAEIADNDIRGHLGTYLQFSRNIGIILAYLLGAYLDYIKSAMVFAVGTVIFFATFSFLPSTPQYLLQRNKIEEAEKSYKFYKGYGKNEISTSEIAQFDNLKTVAKEIEEDSSISLKDLWEARKGLVQSIIIPLLNQLASSYIFLTYGTKIIEQAGTHLPPKIASIFLAPVTIVGTILTSQLVDRKGRKFLLILSMIGCTFSHASLIAYLYLHNSGIDTTSFHWTPVVCMASVVLLASAGIVPLTFICLVEAFPVKIRSLGVTIGNVAINIFAFITVKTFPILSQVIGLVNCLTIFCICCAAGALYIILFVDETNGKELNVTKNNNVKSDNDDTQVTRL